MKNSLDVDRLLLTLSEILSERTGTKVTVRKGESNHDICGVKEVRRFTVAE